MDACAADLMRPAMYGAYHHVTVAGQAGGPGQVATLPGDARLRRDGRPVREQRQVRPRPCAARGRAGGPPGHPRHGRPRPLDGLQLQRRGCARRRCCCARTARAELIRRAETPLDYFATLDGRHVRSRRASSRGRGTPLQTAQLVAHRSRRRQLPPHRAPPTTRRPPAPTGTNTPLPPQGVGMDIRNLEGSIVALVTPFDAEGIGRLSTRWGAWWTSTSPTAPTASSPSAPRARASTMTDEEDDAVCAFVVERVAGRVPVIAGSGSNSTATMLAKSLSYQTPRRRRAPHHHALLQQGQRGGHLPPPRHRGGRGGRCRASSTTSPGAPAAR